MTHAKTTAEWEAVAMSPHACYGDNPSTYRLKVPGGWLYKVVKWGEAESAVALCFVPTPLKV